MDINKWFKTNLLSLNCSKTHCSEFRTGNFNDSFNICYNNHQITNTTHKNFGFDVWLTVHRSSMWTKKPTKCHLVLYLFLLYNLLNMFRATMCPSSGAEDLVVFLPRVV